MSAPHGPLPVPAAPIHHFATYHGGDAGGDDGDDPSRRKPIPSTHQADAPPARKKKKTWLRRRRPDGAPDISPPCPVCTRSFWSLKALHGHMRTHPEREWRGLQPPDQRQPRRRRVEKEAAESLIVLSEGSSAAPMPAFACNGCGRAFLSRQALGGHRATHRNVPGCFAIGKDVGGGSDEDKGNQPAVETAPGLKGKGVQIDLNLPAPEEEEDDDNESVGETDGSSPELNH